MDTKEIVVSVFMLVYNQEAIVHQAIEGVLNQKTDFKYQLVIGEDGSTDGTLAICQQYQQQYPDKIKLLVNKPNIGLIANFMKTAEHLTGKYIAICDGDDYWVDNRKLQKQVTFLEANTSYSIVYAKTEKLYPNGTTKIFNAQPTQHQPKGFTEIVEGNFIASVTVLLKNPLLKTKLPQWFATLPYGDWPLYLMALVDGGKIHYVDEVVAVYRMAIGESFKLFKSRINTEKVQLQILTYMLHDAYFKSRKQEITKAIANRRFQLMLAYNKGRSYGNGFITFMQLVTKQPLLKLVKFYFYSIYTGINAKHSTNIS